MGDEDAEPDGPVETFGVLRLPLKSGTASGYVGVRRVKKSKKRPWQAWVHIKGEKRRCLGSFTKRQEAAVARARALACGPETLPSPRKQAARKSGACPLPVLCEYLNHLIFTALGMACVRIVLCAVKRSAGMALTPDTLSDLNRENVSHQHVASCGSGSVPASSAAAAFAACAYTPPYTCSVQTARRLLPGQPLPQGVAAFAMAFPARHPD